jgi:uncharacterized protein YndB with AHSA1/START domain
MMHLQLHLKSRPRNPDVGPGEVWVGPGESTVEVTFEPDGDHTQLRLVHRQLPEASRADHAEGWEQLFARLAEVASES